MRRWLESLRWSNLDEQQQVGLGKWAMFSVAFGLTSFFFTFLQTGFNASELFGDGSLVLVGLSLVIAAGSAAFDDVSKIKSHWAWFGVCAMILLLTAGAYGQVRTDLRDAESAEDGSFPSLRESLDEGYREVLMDSDGAYSATELAAIISTHMAEFESAWDGSETQDGPGAESTLAEKEDAIAALLAPIAVERMRRDEQANHQLDRAQLRATLTGVASLIVGLLLGSWVVLMVNRPNP